MLPDGIAALIRQEQADHGGRFIEGVDLEAYLQKLGTAAEVLADFQAGACRGVVAFYANDEASRRAFITLVLVAPAWRGNSLSAALVRAALDICRARGFTHCGLEVRHDNDAALAVYWRLGFVVVEDRGDRALMEIAL